MRCGGGRRGSKVGGGKKYADTSSSVQCLHPHPPPPPLPTHLQKVSVCVCVRDQCALSDQLCIKHFSHQDVGLPSLHVSLRHLGGSFWDHRNDITVAVGGNDFACYPNHWPHHLHVHCTMYYTSTIAGIILDKHV